MKEQDSIRELKIFEEKYTTENKSGKVMLIYPCCDYSVIANKEIERLKRLDENAERIRNTFKKYLDENHDLDKKRMWEFAVKLLESLDK